MPIDRNDDRRDSRKVKMRVFFTLPESHCDALPTLVIVLADGSPLPARSNLRG